MAFGWRQEPTKFVQFCACRKPTRVIWRIVPVSPRIPRQCTLGVRGWRQAPPGALAAGAQGSGSATYAWIYKPEVQYRKRVMKDLAARIASLHDPMRQRVQDGRGGCARSSMQMLS